MGPLNLVYKACFVVLSAFFQRCGEPSRWATWTQISGFTSSVWMCSNLSASHCLIFLSFPAVKNRWVLGTNWRNMTLQGNKQGDRGEMMSAKCPGCGEKQYPKPRSGGGRHQKQKARRAVRKADERWDERAAGVKSQGGWSLQSPWPQHMRSELETPQSGQSVRRHIVHLWTKTQHARNWVFGLDLLAVTCHHEQTWSGGSRQSLNPRSSRFCQQSRWR